MIHESTDVSRLSCAAQEIELPVVSLSFTASAEIEHNPRGLIAAGRISITLEVAERDAVDVAPKLFTALAAAVGKEIDEALQEVGTC